MAKKNRGQQGAQQQKGVSKPESFTHGMVSDLDPHFQLSGSYADAQNIRLTNSEGDTFTVENIEGNSLFVNLASFPISVNEGEGGGTTYADYKTFYDRGPDNISISNNQELSNRCSIVGHVSYANQLLLVIVGRFEWDRNNQNPISSTDGSSIENTEIDRTIFLLVDFDHEFKVKKVSDLRVCYNQGNPAQAQYPNLNMDLDTPIRMEHIVENDVISRVYWTDNKNPLRTLNIKQDRLDLINQNSLDITPLMNPSQATLASTLSGSLPVGVYQYTYKYISENGGESTFAPLSNMYHVSDQAFGNSTLYAGGPKGNIGTQGFQIDVKDIDQNFAYVELYALFYEDNNAPPRVAVVARNQISGLSSNFQHTNWNNEVENGLEEILIESNTFDVCKDIAIKDNILFAANLRQKRNFISEQEWNVKVLRYRLANSAANRLDAMLTTNDIEVKHYQLDSNGDPVSINDIAYDYSVQDEFGYKVGHGQLLGVPNSMYEASNTYDFINYNDTKNIPMWTTALSNQRAGYGAAAKTWYQTHFLYKYLSDKMTVGAESFNYATNGLGGCRVSFGVQEKIGDQSKNAWSSPFVSSTNLSDEVQTEFADVESDSVFDGASGETKFRTSMSLGGSKDPHLAGNLRGYQRGDVYRFGVQIYDLNGAPGNVLWIGDIETPHQYDVNRMIDIKNENSTNGLDYTPFRPTTDGGGSSWNALDNSSGTDTDCIVAHKFIKDFRLAFAYGHTVPPVDVEWFTQRTTTTGVGQNLNAYIKSDGAQRDDLPGTTGTDYSHAGGQVRAVPAYLESRGGADITNHDDIYYLFDLYVSFEFIIPDSVCKKISGFRVVRAQRTEEDKRVVHQGLLNQTVQYGSAKLGQKYGYGAARFCQKDNEAFDGDPVFVNQYNDPTGGVDPTLPEQPEYNTYLNGYLGLAEHSFMAFHEDSTSDGEVTTGGNSAGKVFYWPEREDMKKWQYVANVSNGSGHARGRGDNAGYSFGGPGTYGLHKRHCGYFGSYDKTTSYATRNVGFGGTGEYDIGRVGATSNNTPSVRYGYTPRYECSGSVFTLDAPDSAFGIRPYVYREGDMLRIDDCLKLTDEGRFNDRSTGNPFSYYSNCNTEVKTYSGSEPVDWSENSHVELWQPYGTNKSLYQALQFCTSKTIDRYYRALIGKFCSYDPYIGIGMEIDGGKFIGGGGGNAGWRPNSEYGWQLPIANSKELSDGEIVPSGFFKHNRRVDRGEISGFSNNTLGVCNEGKHEDSGQVFRVFDAVAADQVFLKGKTAADGEQTNLEQEDYNYDTVSTMQMGLRSILIEIDNRVHVVRKNGSADDATDFAANYNNMTASNRKYDAWFSPQNWSALYEHGFWGGIESDGNQYPSGGNNTPYNGYVSYPFNSGWLTRYWDNNVISTDNHDSGGDLKIHYSGSKDLVPFKYLCSIVRNVVAYGGYSKGSIEKTRYIPCGNFHPVGDSNPNNTAQGHVSQVFGGDTFVNLYTHQKTSSPYMKHSASRWQLFPVESYVNTDMRSGLTLNAGDTVIGKDMNQAPYSNDWLYNNVYSQENSLKSGLMVDEKTFQKSLNLPYEIAYSNTKILGQKSDAFRQFPINQFHDMEGLYGEINRIVNFKNEIYVLQDSAFAKLLVNPLSMLSDDAGTSLFTGTGETVENHIYISTKYGSRHRFSVAMSEKSLYFVDSNFGRLFKYDTEKLISLGDALGQRNYLKYIIKEWEQRAYRECTSTSGTGGAAGGVHAAGPVVHGTNYGMLDSLEKPTDNRNYLSDNPLRFLGITSIYDYKNKELLVTFHNSTWESKDHHRQQFSRKSDNHLMGSTRSGEPVGTSETLVYSEAVNAFISKYSVAPPQWLAGGQGSFMLCPENEISVNAITNFSRIDGLQGNYYNIPYYDYGASDNNTALGTSVANRKRRCNPLSLWIWDKHKDNKKTHFFGKKDDLYTISTITSSVSGQVELDNNGNAITGLKIAIAGTIEMPDESYIVKVINSEAARSKVFDNVQVVMTPKHVDYSFIDYTTDISHDTIKTTTILPDQDGNYRSNLLDETEQLVINRRWDFTKAIHGWWFYDGTATIAPPITTNGIELVTQAGNKFRSPGKGLEINIHGKYNNKIRMKVKRVTNTSDWLGRLRWVGYEYLEKEKGSFVGLGESPSRQSIINVPTGIDSDYVIAEWDMAGTSKWDESIIERIRIDLSNGSEEYHVEWIEIIGLQADKYIDGVLKAPIRTAKSTRRTRGTYAKIKYSAKTTEKFNIFAILAKYRKTY